MKKALLFAVVLSALLGSVSPAVVRRVPAEYPSIQQAITDANDGDTVLVSPGVYYEKIDFSGKNITVTSTDPNDRGIVGYTIINAQGEGTVVTFTGGETNKAVLAGFTITGGTGTLSEWSDEFYKDIYGGGIYCNYNAAPTITRCVITRNNLPYYRIEGNMQYEYAYSYGGGIYCSGSRAVITHNTIYNNSAGYGGGMYVSNSTVSNNLIYNNSAANGGGAYVYYSDLVGNTIVNNDCSKVWEGQTGLGGNVYVTFSYYDNGLMANNVICGAKSGGGLFHRQATKDLIRFNDVWDNLPTNYGTSDPRTGQIVVDEKADWTGRSGNISENPRFRNSSMNDFHLQGDSPCVSAGDPNFLPGPNAVDIDRDPRVFARRVDMGYDEFVGYVKPLADAGDDQHKLAPEAVTLDAGDSYFADPNGTKVYQWRQVQGTAVALNDAAAQAPTFTPPAEGWYVFEVVVGDGQYTSKPDRVLVVIGNKAPVAHAGADRLWSVQDIVVLDGSRSSDADPPDVLTYTWKQIEGPAVASLLGEFSNRLEPTVYFQGREPGVYAFELVVSDGFTTSAPDTVRIETTAFAMEVNDVSVPAIEENVEARHVAASGTRVVSAVFSYNDTSWKIHNTDLESERTDILQSQSVNVMPDVEGDLAVWATGSGRFYNPMCTSVVAADLATGLVHTVRAASSTESYGYPAISGRKAVWLHHRGVNTGDATQYAQTPYDICGADLTDPAKPVYFTIAEQAGRGVPFPPESYYQVLDSPIDMSGNLVVWEANGDIFGADISDLRRIKVFPICTAAETQSSPAISGHIVVWTDQRDDAGDIYGADISDPNHVREFEVYVSPGPQSQPDIDGQLIAFVNSPANSTGSVMLCCLSRAYGPVAVTGLPEWYEWLYGGNNYRWYYGSNPKVTGSTVAWVYSGEVQGFTLRFGYGLADGPVQNVTAGTHHDSMQHAIDIATAGDVIQVQPGIYSEKVRFNGKNVTLTSANPEDPAVRAATVIAGSGPQVLFVDDETADCALAGFTIIGGSYGVLCSGSTPLIENCTIADNSYAGVKVWYKGRPTVSRCEIVGNGMGVDLWTPRDKRVLFNNFGTFRNCLIAGNLKAGVSAGYPTLENCTVADNLGVGVEAIQATIANSIIYFNNQDGGGVNLTVEKAKSVVTYSDVQGGWVGAGNIDADPLFLARGRWVPTPAVVVPIGTGNRVTTVPGTPVWTVGDYHLQSQGWSWNVATGTWAWDDATSPCIDAGDPAAPLGDEQPCASGDPLSERAGVNTRIDMGAYGGTPEASLAPRAQTPQP